MRQAGIHTLGRVPAGMAQPLQHRQSPADASGFQIAAMLHARVGRSLQQQCRTKAAKALPPCHNLGPTWVQQVALGPSAAHFLQGCYEAFKRRLNASHAVSCVPGTQAVSDKAGLAASLEAAYGPDAWGIVPRTFRLPGEYAALAAYIKQVRLGSARRGLGAEQGSPHAWREWA